MAFSLHLDAEVQGQHPEAGEREALIGNELDSE